MSERQQNAKDRQRLSLDMAWGVTKSSSVPDDVSRYVKVPMCHPSDLVIQVL